MRCDCGFDFTTASRDVLDEELASTRRTALGGVVVALAIMAGVFFFAAVTSERPAGPWILRFTFIGGLALLGRSLTKLRDVRAARKDIQSSESSRTDTAL
jgi:hypothetical protein